MPQAPPPALYPQAERRALLDRVQQLSRAEAEASAALERLRMENDALAAELAHSQVGAAAACGVCTLCMGA